MLAVRLGCPVKRRRKRIEAREALRKAEEEYMEQRRQELLSDKDGYWHQRMRMEEQVRVGGGAVQLLVWG